MAQVAAAKMLNPNRHETSGQEHYVSKNPSLKLTR